MKTKSAHDSGVLEGNVGRMVELCYHLIEARHPILGLQTRGVVDLCRLAQETGYFTEEEYRVLEVSAWLQNVGFMGMTADLIHRFMEEKHEEITEDEWAQIRRNPEHAEALTQHLEGDLSRVADVIRGVNEHWDGSGYPDGRARENLPKETRYLAVATRYVRSREYPHDTVERILRDIGTVFYPEAVRLFLKVTEAIVLPEKVCEILFSELEEGMVLAYPVHTPMGLLLYPEDKVIDSDVLSKLKSYNDVEPIWDRILVYR